MENAAVRILALPGLAAVAVCLALLCARLLVAALDGALKKWRRLGIVVLMAAVATVEAQESGERGMDDFSRVERVDRVDGRGGDINDYNNNFILDPDDHIASPGKLWAAIGPTIMLGYNFTAPLDKTAAPARIIADWRRLRSSQNDIDAWMKANDNLNGRNACAIDSARNYHYFKKLFWKTYIKTTVLKARQ